MAQAVNGDAMPLGNETGMTEDERQQAWRFLHEPLEQARRHRRIRRDHGRLPDHARRGQRHGRGRLRRRLRRHRRAFALGGRARPRRSARSPAGATMVDAFRRRGRARPAPTAKLALLARPPGPRRPRRDRRRPRRGIPARAGRRRPRPADGRGIRPLHRAERRLHAPSSAFPSSWRCSGADKHTILAAFAERIEQRAGGRVRDRVSRRSSRIIGFRLEDRVRRERVRTRRRSASGRRR